MLKVIEDAGTIKACQASLQAAVESVTTEKHRILVGFPGGNAEALVYYVKSLDFWMTLKPIANRYWNCVALGYPFKTHTPAPHVEINPPLSGIDRRVAGAFLVDEEGREYLGHSGKVGGGATGVSKKNFLAYYPAWTEVLSGDQTVPMYVIGCLDDADLPRRIRDFTRYSAEFRRQIKQGEALDEAVPAASTDTFSPEFEGIKVYSTAERVASVCLHGAVVRALHAALAIRGIHAFNSIHRDLYVPADDGTMAILFEVKSTRITTDIYGAVGQLMVHGGAGRARQLVAVVPGPLSQTVAHRLNELGVVVLEFKADEDDQVTFPDLEPSMVLPWLEAGS